MYWQYWVLDRYKIEISIATSEEDDRSQIVVGLVGVVKQGAEPSIHPGTNQFFIRSLKVENQGSKVETAEEIVVRCFTRDARAATELTEVNKFKFTGDILKNFRGKSVFYSFNVEKWEEESHSEIEFDKASNADTFPF